jgi:hypothetical protein
MCLFPRLFSGSGGLSNAGGFRDVGADGSEEKMPVVLEMASARRRFNHERRRRANCPLLAREHRVKRCEERQP